MIDIILNMFKIFWDCFMLIFNIKIPFYGEREIQLGALAIAFITIVFVVYFVLKNIGIIRKGDS